MPESIAPSGKGRILAVDDDPADLEFLMTVLRNDGYSVFPTAESLWAMRTVQTVMPDLILLDAHMPTMDGYQLCQHMKESSATHDIPIIFVSGADSLLDKVKAFSKGGVDYILKPYQAEEVLARVKTHLSLRNLQKTLEKRVQERTADLMGTNASLLVEIDARERAETELKRHRDRLEELVIERTAALTDAKNALELQNEELKRLAESAEKATRAKSAFLANVSHELRTPLNAILGYAQLLKLSATLTDTQARGLDTIEQAGRHLLALIVEILDLARIESGKLELQPKLVAMHSFLHGVSDLIRVRAQEKRLVFEYEEPPDLPKVFFADEKALRQVLLNLLGNAVKFTDQGRVRLDVRCTRPLEATIELHFEVSDSGAGISEEHFQTIFAPFEQVGDVSRRVGGTGLGLSISRELVRLMGGEISVESRLGEGSRFWFDVRAPL